MRVIDLFAGSGALGLEALSRGASFCRFVENDREAVEALRANVSALAVTERSEIVIADATRLSPWSPVQGETFDLAFLDAPYGGGGTVLALGVLATAGLLAPRALVVVERGGGEGTLVAPGFTLLDTRKWGVAQVDFLN